MASRSASSSIPPPRVVVVGAGISGLSASSHLLLHSPPSSFRLLLLEASSRLGGRIRTSSFSSSQVELGATWIHGIDGSPIYDLALRSNPPSPPASYERCDGFPPRASLLADGGLPVDDSLVDPVVEAFTTTLAVVKRGGAGGGATTVGGFVRQGLHAFLRQEASHGKDEEPELGCGWSRRSLQEAVYKMQEDAERLNTASNSLFDLDLESEKEYREYPGEHVTIAGGYKSVVEEMARCLPPGTIQLGKKVSKVVWNHQYPYPSSPSPPVVICCEDGSVIEADHVILTMSLGALKSATVLPEEEYCAGVGGACRSVDDLIRKVPSPAGFYGRLREDSRQRLFDPPLPMWKLQSIARLGFGVVDKLFLELDPMAAVDAKAISSVEFVHRPTHVTRDSPVPSWMSKTFSICPIYQGSNVLLCWFAGEQALEMEGLSDEEIMDGVAATLASFGLLPTTATAMGSPPRVFRRILRSNWASDPLYRGSYTFVAAGASGKDIEGLAEPLPSLPGHLSSLHHQLQNSSNLKKGGIGGGILSSSAATLENVEEHCDMHTRMRRPVAASAISSSTMSLSSASSTISSTESESSACSSSEGDSEEECEDMMMMMMTTMTAMTIEAGEEQGGAGSAAPPLQLLFAGEATHRNYYSTTHGAFLSGVREANRILNLYGYGKNA